MDRQRQRGEPHRMARLEDRVTVPPTATGEGQTMMLSAADTLALVAVLADPPEPSESLRNAAERYRALPPTATPD